MIIEEFPVPDSEVGQNVIVAEAGQSVLLGTEDENDPSGVSHLLCSEQTSFVSELGVDLDEPGPSGLSLLQNPTFLSSAAIATHTRQVSTLDDRPRWNGNQLLCSEVLEREDITLKNDLLRERCAPGKNASYVDTLQYGGESRRRQQKGGEEVEKVGQKDRDKETIGQKRTRSRTDGKSRLRPERRCAY